LQRVTLGKHRVRLHATRGLPAERLRVMADVAWLAVERNVSARARLVEVVFRDQDGAYDIPVGTTAAEDRTCEGPIEAAVAVILGPTPERVALTVRTVSQDEVDLSFDTYERLLAQKMGATAPIQSVSRMPPKLAKLGPSAGSRDGRRIYGPPAGRRRSRNGR
jgi:hypothetical protein